MSSDHSTLTTLQTAPRATQVFIALLQKIRHGGLHLTMHDGSQHHFGDAHMGVQARLHLHDERVCEALLARGDIGFGETYMEGWWSSSDIAALIQIAVQNRAEFSSLLGGNALRVGWYRIKHLLRRNTRAGSRKNILAHYDLGNAFYAHWLDSSMTYSSALFAGDYTQTLQQAQSQKYSRIANQLGLHQSAQVLEIGCGWGGFAEAAIGRYGAQVDGVTLSPSQLSFAQARLKKLGLHERANLTLTDYRDVRGHYDFIVSIEMFEAVGEAYWPTYFAALKRLLKADGKALVQTITIADAQFASYRKGTDFIQQYIFPGGMLPSLEKFTELANAAGLRVVDAHPFGADYAHTLRHWRAEFAARWHDIAPLGFDEKFRRLWHFYLAYCEGGFDAGATNVYQIQLEHI
ncbi:MAG: cyclopropane-fatty-acyl-phospholipid synthase family protein [Gallionella sp.]